MTFKISGIESNNSVCAANDDLIGLKFDFENEELEKWLFQAKIFANINNINDRSNLALEINNSNVQITARIYNEEYDNERFKF